MAVTETVAVAVTAAVAVAVAVTAVAASWPETQNARGEAVRRRGFGPSASLGEARIGG